jgi:adenine-specific DNA-methyltransferase
LGQVFTPVPVAQRIASQVSLRTAECLTVLDPGAGIGSLCAALVDRVIRERGCPSLDITAIEIDSTLTDALRATLEDCRQTAADHGVGLTYSLLCDDFIAWASEHTDPGMELFNSQQRFDIVIQNPPYGKSGRNSRERQLLSHLRTDIPNLYAAFVLLGARLLATGGQMVAIIPRSFTNGRYFRSFRRDLLAAAGIDRIAAFHERGALFADSAVLQETVILTVTRDIHPSTVKIETSRGYSDPAIERLVPYADVVKPNDPEMFVHITTKSQRCS